MGVVGSASARLSLLAESRTAASLHSRRSCPENSSESVSKAESILKQVNSAQGNLGQRIDVTNLGRVGQTGLLGGVYNLSIHKWH